MPDKSAQKHVILFLAANPASSAQLALDQECRAIEHELRLSSTRDSFLFQSKWAVDVHEMMRHLNALQPTIVHFSGHGGAAWDLHARPAAGSIAQRDIGDGGDRGAEGIHLHGEAGEAQTVGPDALAQMIRSAAPSARIVVLNACFSEAVAEAFRGTIDCVVGMHGAIGDDAARAFSVGFYRALGYDRSVGNAMAQANAGLAALKLPGHALPILRTRDGVVADGLYLSPPAQAHAGHAEPPRRASSAAREVLSRLRPGAAPLHDDELFAASLRHYPTLVHASKELKETFVEHLIRCVDKHVFQTFAADDDWQLRLARYAPDSELYVAITVRGRFDHEKCRLELGLWWPRDPDAKVASYAGLHDVPWGQKLKPTKPETQRDVTSSLTYLRREASHGAELDGLLDELEAAALLARAS